MPAFYYPKLESYQLAMEFAVIANDIAARLPRNYYFLADQLRRASLSIPLNIAEGSASHTYKTRLQRFATANGSAAECHAIFDFVKRSKLLPAEDRPTAMVERIGAMMYGSLRKHARNAPQLSSSAAKQLRS
jgi:four helix bundle protein